VREQGATPAATSVVVSEMRAGHPLLDSRLPTPEPMQDAEPRASISGARTPELVIEELLAALAAELGTRIS